MLWHMPDKVWTFVNQVELQLLEANSKDAFVCRDRQETTATKTVPWGTLLTETVQEPGETSTEVRADSDQRRKTEIE